MHHIEEHTLELYVLNAKEVETKRQDIEAHLAECIGCRKLMEEMTAFHAELSEELKEVPNFDTPKETALVRSPSRVFDHNILPDVYDETYGETALYRPNTFVGKFSYFIRRHPMAAVGGTFSLAAALVFASMLFMKNETANPTRWQYNTTTSTIDVYDKEYKLLWQLPSPELTQKGIDHERNAGWKTLLADLDGDGKNELITTHVLAGDLRVNEIGNKLRVLDVASKKVLWEIQFLDSIHYLNRQYSPYYGPSVPLVIENRTSGQKEIIVDVGNVGRSPAFIARIDAKGNILGKYWHFGNLGPIYAVDIDGQQNIFACGTNDTQDSVMGEFSVVVVLDPRKIIGRTRSTACSAIELPASNAEIHYLKFPGSDLNIALKQTPVNQFMHLESNDVVRFSVSTTTQDGTLWDFDYFFSREMLPLYVKSNNQTDRVHERLREQGKVTGTIDKAYLENLRNGIRFWDGKEWRKELTMVQHSNTGSPP